MARQLTKTNQSFEVIASNNYFFVDKTMFIREWWKKGEAVTLVTRPRRFGKTLTLNMLECFFSIQYKDKADLFSRYDISKDAEMMQKQGKYPVIAFSLATSTGSTYQSMLLQLSSTIRKVYERVEDNLNLHNVNQRDRKYMEMILAERFDEDHNPLPLSEDLLMDSLNRLSRILYKNHGNTKVIILLDEYDAPLENAYLRGYWDKAAEFFGNFYKNTFKVNAYLERALVTGINMLPKESLNSPFNNPDPCSVLDSSYGDVFGFTQQEVDDALREYKLIGQREEVKRWYDGYQFGDWKDMYNPWSICFMMEKRKTGMYWANTASNEIVSLVLKNGSIALKDQFFTLMQGGSVTGKVKDTVTFKTLRSSKDAVWGLLVTCGYLKAIDASSNGYALSIVNHEVMEMMDDLVLDWFSTNGDTAYEDFISAMVACDAEGMNETLARLSLELMGSADTATGENSKDAENFHHGFVLGLLASTRNRFVVTSNRESGKGRYDIMMEPLDKTKDQGIIIEFKVFNPKKEKDLEGTCQRALQQIEDKKYDIELKKHGIQRIAKFGIGYSGKDVLVTKK